MMRKIFLSTTLIAGLMFLVFSCSKKAATSPDSSYTSQKILYKRDALHPKNTLLGANIEEVSTISIDDAILSQFSNSNEWKELKEKYSLKLSEMLRTSFNTATVEMVSIPIQNSDNAFNVYVKDEKFFITQFSITKLANGNKLYKVASLDDKLFYQFEVNKDDKMGNWTFGKDISLNKVFGKKIGAVKNMGRTARASVEASEGDCAALPFGDCMNCLIIGICGSNWMCTVACGLALYSCVGAAAAVCVIG